MQEAECKAFADEMAYLQKDPNKRGPKPNPEMREPGNTQIEVDDRGIVRLVDQGTGALESMAGDIDLCQITKADGSPWKVTDDFDEYDDLMDRLVEADLIEHDVHLAWRTRSAKEAGIKQGIIAKHESGEDLIEFSPDGQARMTQAADVPE